MTGSLQIKNDIYYVVLNLKDENGKRKQKWINTNLPMRGNKKKAEKILRELLDEYEAQEANSEKKDFPFVDYLYYWLNLKKPQIDPLTCELYQYCIDSHIVQYFNPKKLDIRDVTYTHLQKYFNDKSINGKIIKSKKDKKNNTPVGLSTETLNKHKIVFMQAFKNAVLEKLINSNPVLDVTVPKKQKKKAGFLTLEEADDLIQRLKGETIRSIVIFALYYGLRRSEILGLKWSAVDLKNGFFRIEHTVVKSILNNGVKAYYKDSTKTKTSASEFPILEDVVPLLKEIAEKQKANREIFGNSYYESDYLFTWDDGKLIQPDYVSKRFKKLLKKYSMPDIHFHNLRHSTASILVKKGFDIKSIQMWLRHANVKTTLNIYAQVSENQKQVIAGEISHMFSLSK